MPVSNNNIEIQDLKQSLDDDSSDSFESSSKSGSNNSEDSQSLIDFTPMIDQLRIDLQQEAEMMHNDLKALILNNLQDQRTKISEVEVRFVESIASIKRNYEEYTVFIKKKMVEVELCIQQAVNECNSASAQRKRDHNDNISQFKSISNALNELESQENALSDSIENINKSILSLTEFCKIGLSLQSQDENDRESIALMGYKKTKKNTIVSIDKRCLSCAGQSASVLSAFKIACLAYEPSLVMFQSRKFTRKELLNLQNKLLSSNLITFDQNFSEEDRSVHNKTMLTSKQ